MNSFLSYGFNDTQKPSKQSLSPCRAHLCAERKPMKQTYLTVPMSCIASLALGARAIIVVI